MVDSFADVAISFLKTDVMIQPTFQSSIFFPRQTSAKLSTRQIVSLYFSSDLAKRISSHIYQYNVDMHLWGIQVIHVKRLGFLGIYDEYLVEREACLFNEWIFRRPAIYFDIVTQREIIAQ